VKIIAVASGNPVKVAAARGAFGRMFPEEQFELRPIAVASGVGAQPLSSAETLAGAERRVDEVAQRARRADYWVGIEGGVEEGNDGMLAFAWVVVHSTEGSGRARSASFVLPGQIAELIRQGRELGDANDLVFGRENSKQQEGAVGLLTDGAMDRRELYEQAVLLALIPLKQAKLYAGGTPETA
jgi:inosine/xanthosine triphosphatase